VRLIPAILDKLIIIFVGGKNALDQLSHFLWGIRRYDRERLAEQAIFCRVILLDTQFAFNKDELLSDFIIHYAHSFQVVASRLPINNIIACYPIPA